MTKHESPTSVSMSEVLLAKLPLEIWTECDDGQALLQLAREGRCRHIRMNATLGRFEKIDPLENYDD